MARLTVKHNLTAHEVAVSRAQHRGRATTSEAAVLLGKCAATILEWAKTNKIQSVWISNRCYIPLEALLGRGVKLPFDVTPFDSNDGASYDYDDDD